MASLSPPFILCPLPDRQALLGIRGDRASNKAIITLGKNIAIRYHVPEQKQESTWTTSRYWFTSPVTYCHDLGKYGAVLNHNIVALWDEEDSNLSNITKLKLNEHIFDLHSNFGGKTVVVMKNGMAAYYKDLCENKSLTVSGLSVLDPKGAEVLLGFDVNVKENQCYLFTKRDDKVKHKLTLIVTSISEIEPKKKPSRLSFGSESEETLGFCVIRSETDTFLAFVGSDGHMYKQNIRDSKPDAEPTKLANLSKYVHNSNPVVLCPLSDNSTVAIYGSDPSEEGAVVVMYDIHYDVVVSKQQLKLYSIPPLMEAISQSLFVPLGLHILVLNYKITKSLLSSVLGKHQAKLDEEVFEGRNPWNTTGWDVDVAADVRKKGTGTSGVVPALEEGGKEDKSRNLQSLKATYPKSWEIIQQVKILESEGQPESVICNHVIPLALEKKNEAALDWIINTILDIPEVHMVSMIIFCLENVSFSKDGKSFNAIDERLNQLLARKFDKRLLTLSLRHVGYDDSKKLLLYVNDLIKNHWELNIESGDLEERSSSVKSWLHWCSALIDAHYTKFVLHSDMEIIENLLETMEGGMSVLKVIEELEPYVTLTLSKTTFEPTHDRSKWRTETVTFE